jgi:cell division cycle 2-like protein
MVRWKAQAQSRLREHFPSSSFAGQPHLSNAGFQLLNGFLSLAPEQRMSAAGALDHEYFSESPVPLPQAQMTTVPPRHAAE